MTELKLTVTLEFACCACQQPVSVTVRCAGKGLIEGPRPVAAVNVPCPNCNGVNRVLFEPAGRVRRVGPYAPRIVPEPSVN
jgi:hypothetical protein